MISSALWRKGKGVGLLVRLLAGCKTFSLMAARTNAVQTVLLFKKKFLAAIAAGEKTQTIRLWKHRKLRPGQRSYIPGVGYIGILEVEPIALDELVDADAIPDGFPSAEALRTEIQSLYGPALSDGSRTWRIKFRVFDAVEQAEARRERQARKAQSAATRSAETQSAVTRSAAIHSAAILPDPA